MQPRVSGKLPDRLRLALEWWELLLQYSPARKLHWDSRNSRPVYDVYTDASAEDKWEGLGVLHSTLRLLALVRYTHSHLSRWKSSCRLATHRR